MSNSFEPFGDRSAAGARATSTGDESPEALTGGTALVFATLLASQHNRCTYEELAERCWPVSRPAHWKRLILLYSRWLEKRLPPGWTIMEDHAGFQLGHHGRAIEDFVLVNGIIIDTSSSAVPSDAVDAGSVVTSDTHLAHRGSGACVLHEGTHTSLPSLVAEAGLTAITYRPGERAPEPHVWRDVIAAEGRPPGFAFVAGAAPDLAFGDAAAAFGAARWELLDVNGATQQARVARAWRILREHLPNADRRDGSSRIGVIFDAHLLDDSSLELAQLIVRFPLAEDMHIAFVGDSSDPRQRWQQLLADLADAGCLRFELCPDCDPSLLSGYQIAPQPSLCGKH